MNRLSLLEAIKPTTFLKVPRLCKKLGVELTLASETFQQTGSFKFRAAYNLALNVTNSHIITASSGNFGQALAYACKLLGKRCSVVMPANSARVKVEAVIEYGAKADLIDVKKISRADRVRELAEADPSAYVASAYDDPLVIEGNATLGVEIAERGGFDIVIAPIGGGGLSSGIITGMKRSGFQAKMIGAEPLMANDAARSLRAGYIVKNETEPQTIADGARTVSLGQHNWPIIGDGMLDIVEVPEENIIEGVRLLFSLANLKSEPTGAVSVGAILTQSELFNNRSVCAVVSGGNVDADVYKSIL